MSQDNKEQAIEAMEKIIEGLMEAHGQVLGADTLEEAKRASRAALYAMRGKPA